LTSTEEAHHSTAIEGNTLVLKQVHSYCAWVDEYLAGRYAREPRA
jgi:hypothetical protein